MRSLPVGALVAAIVMFALGFVFYGVLGTMIYTPLDPAAADAVQGALAQHLSATGTHMVPAEEEAWMRGPGAVVHFVAAGSLKSMPVTMALGFLNFFVASFLIGLGLKASGGDASRQMALAFWYGLGASVFAHLGDPIWYGFAWAPALTEFVFDTIMLVAAGLVLAKWFTSERPAASVEAPAAA